MTAVAGELCALIRERGPRWGVEVAVVSFRRFAVTLPVFSSVLGASGASVFDVVHSPIVPSVEAERIR